MLRGSKELECLFAQLFVVRVIAALSCTDKGSANGGLSDFIIFNELNLYQLPVTFYWTLALLEIHLTLILLTW